MPPKKVSAADLEALEKELKDVVGDMRRKLTLELNEVTKNLQNQLEKNFEKSMDESAKTAKQDTAQCEVACKAHTDGIKDALIKRYDPLFTQVDSLKQGVAECKQREKELHQFTIDTGNDVRAETDVKFSAVDSKFSKAITELRAHVLNRIDEERDFAANALEAQAEHCRKEFIDVRRDIVKVNKYVDKVKAEAAERDVETRQIAQNGFDAVALVHIAMDERMTEDKEEIMALVRTYDDAIEGCHIRAKAEEAKIRLEFVVLDDILREECRDSLAMLVGQNAMFRKSITSVFSLVTRRVYWVISRARSSLSKTGTWFSPLFDAGGCHDLQLELRLIGPGDVAHDAEKKDAPKKGDLMVYLWACAGVALTFKITVGSKSEVVEGDFQLGKLCFPTGRMGFIEKELNKEEDTLRIGIDILEFARTIEQKIELADEVKNAEEKAEDSKEGLDIEGRVPNLEGTMVTQQHISHRLLSQVTKQVERMRSRMVRHVEWRLEQASALKHAFSAGHSAVSKEFDAAGVEGLQMVFYPCGHTGALENNCSFFLKTPAGVAMQAVLTAGSEKKSVSRKGDQPGGAFGVVNFCLLDIVIDKDQDVILLSVDIEDCHSELAPALADSIPPPTTVGTGEQWQAFAKKDTERWGTPAGNIVKLRYEPARIPPGLEEVKLLPSLWANRNLRENKAKHGKEGMSADSQLRNDHGHGCAGPGKRTESPQLRKSASAGQMRSPPAGKKGASQSRSNQSRPTTSPSGNQGGGESAPPGSNKLPLVVPTGPLEPIRQLKGGQLAG